MHNLISTRELTEQEKQWGRELPPMTIEEFERYIKKENTMVRFRIENGNIIPYLQCSVCQKPIDDISSAMIGFDDTGSSGDYTAIAVHQGECDNTRPEGRMALCHHADTVLRQILGIEE